MKKEVIKTADGSFTLFSRDVGEHYHSVFGAVQESEHIFIDAGLKYVCRSKSAVSVLEVGFGTGLNFLLTLKFALENGVKIDYTGIEPRLPEQNLLRKLNYPEMLNFNKDVFLKIHEEKRGELNGLVKYRIITGGIQNVTLEKERYNLVYFDAFSPEVQPEMWEAAIFGKIFEAMRHEGILTTYSCKGDVKRALKKAGFGLEKLPGPPGKREFLRALKF
jgi:tRNA U34 5-methylaminomethyl-2-thiouridine-forming methyltransferase MnmC